MDPIAVRKIDRVASDLVDRFREFGVATVHEAQGRTGLLHHRLRPIWSGARVAGPAVTVLAHVGDNWAIHVAIELCEPGDVLVVSLAEDEGDDVRGMFGELLGISCQAHGIRALVIDSGVRDTRELTEKGFPVWSRAVSAKGTTKEKPGRINVPIVCAGQAVSPGDLVLADDDGVVIVPRAHAAEVLESSRLRENDEDRVRAQLQDGESTLDLFDMRERLRQAGLEYRDSEVDS